jgi:hypothetical protein
MARRTGGAIPTLVAASPEIVVIELPLNTIGSATESPTSNTTNPYRWVAPCISSFVDVRPRVRSRWRACLLAELVVRAPMTQHCLPSGPSKTCLFFPHTI